MSEDANMVSFHLIYDGKALEDHTMDVRMLAPALLAVGDLVDRANTILNDDRTKVSVNVHASFKTGSFGIDLETAQSIISRIHDLITNPVVADTTKLLSLLGFTITAKSGMKGLIAVVKWLRGRSVNKITPLENGVVRLYIDDEYVETEENVLKLLRDYKLRKALEGMIAPLEQEGIDSVSVMPQKGDEPVFHIERDSAEYFHAPPAQDELLDEDVYEAILQIVSVSFQDGNKWRFSEGVGGNSYYAEIKDNEFLKRVKLNQETFAKEDIIRARIKRIQKVTPAGLRADYEIIKVLEHKTASPKVQFSMDIDDDN